MQPRPHARCVAAGSVWLPATHHGDANEQTSSKGGPFPSAENDSDWGKGIRNAQINWATRDSAGKAG